MINRKLKQMLVLCCMCISFTSYSQNQSKRYNPNVDFEYLFKSYDKVYDKMVYYKKQFLSKKKRYNYVISELDSIKVSTRKIQQINDELVIDNKSKEGEIENLKTLLGDSKKICLYDLKQLTKRNNELMSELNECNEVLHSNNALENALKKLEEKNRLIGIQNEVLCSGKINNNAVDIYHYITLLPNVNGLPFARIKIDIHKFPSLIDSLAFTCLEKTIRQNLDRRIHMIVNVYNYEESNAQLGINDRTNTPFSQVNDPKDFGEFVKNRLQKKFGINEEKIKLVYTHKNSTDFDVELVLFEKLNNP